MNFIVKWFLNYLFTKNINHLLFRLFLKDKEPITNFEEIESSLKEKNFKSFNLYIRARNLREIILESSAGKNLINPRKTFSINFLKSVNLNHKYLKSYLTIGSPQYNFDLQASK